MIADLLTKPLFGKLKRANRPSSVRDLCARPWNHILRIWSLYRMSLANNGADRELGLLGVLVLNLLQMYLYFIIN